MLNVVALIFSVCGDYKVEGDEECDCGMSYETCGDPCCYSAHISSEDLAWNKSAVPCRRHRSPICLRPFRSLLTFGVVIPWAFICCASLILSTFLGYDWKHKKKCFKHITEHAGTIIETNSRHRRVSKSEPRTVMAGSTSIHEMKPVKILKPKGPPPPPPTGVVPYLPPMRSLSQPPTFRNNSEAAGDDSSGSDTPILRPNANHMVSNHVNSQNSFQNQDISRPVDPPPPIPTQQSISSEPKNCRSPPPPILYPKPQISHFFNPQSSTSNSLEPRVKSPPPQVPYNTRPDISKVPYLQKKV